MPMPKNLIFVRHGESEGNVANRMSRRGNNSRIKNEDFQARHSSLWRLSRPTGVMQARWAGDTIRHMGLQVGRKYCSPYFRAMETTAHMQVGGPPAWVVYALRERSWGRLDKLTHEERMRRYGKDMRFKLTDPFLWEPPGGEALVEVIERVQGHFSTLTRECGHMECVVDVCHAELMEVARVVLERMLPQHYNEMKDDATQGIWNGSILHYTRVNPFTHEEGRYLEWVRLITPSEAHAAGETGFDWQEINRPVFTDSQLLAYVERYAPQISYT